MTVRKYKIHPGDVVYGLTIVQETEPIIYPGGTKRKMYLVKCSCGIEYKVKKDNLTCETAIHLCSRCGEEERLKRKKRPNRVCVDRRKIWPELKIDKLTVLSEVPKDLENEGYKRPVFLVRCDCGKILEASSQWLLDKKRIKQCKGCRSKTSIGATFGDLIVLREAGRSVSARGQKIKNLIVKCSCGEEFCVMADSLTTRYGVRRCEKCSLFRKKERSGVGAGWVFGDLTVVKNLDEFSVQPSGQKHRQILVKCVCGRYRKITKSALIRTPIHKCKHTFNSKLGQIDIGDVFDCLTVIKLYGQTYNTRYADCRCSCGNPALYKIRAIGLLKNQSNHCGCRRTPKWKGHQDISGTYFSAIKDGAKKRNLEFNVTIEDIWDVYQRQKGICALSGLVISHKKNGKDREGTASLDRIDSSKGYSKDNVQWVHKRLNAVKQNLTPEEFLFWCIKVVEQAGYLVKDQS